MTNITPDSLLGDLRGLSFVNTFNPYAETCPVFDRSDSAQLRSSILREMLIAASEVEVDAIWIGRDLGHRGGRRTGLALTDDIGFSKHVERWGVPLERPTSGPEVKERTASVIWDMLEQIEDHIFLWNVFPLHPFPEGNMFSNRAHNSAERKAGEIILRSLVALIKPKRIIAIGNDAANVSSKFFTEIEMQHVRHPSYGGEKDFRHQIENLYGLEPVQQRLI